MHVKSCSPYRFNHPAIDLSKLGATSKCVAVAVSMVNILSEL